MSAVAYDTLRILRKRMGYGWNVVRNPANYDYHGVIIPLSATPELERIRKRVYLDVYERYEIEAVRQLVRGDDRVVEIGAGCGVVSTAIAQQLSDCGHLQCFEANPNLESSIRACTEANAVNPKIVMAAVSTSRGAMELFCSDDFLSSSLIRRKNHTTAVTVPVVAFDDILHDVQPSVIMMDVEGAERELLSGELPDCVQTVVAECHPHAIGNRAVSAIIANLVGQGLNFLVDASGERVIAFSKRPELDRFTQRKWLLGSI